jgi:hypothetical protein
MEAQILPSPHHRLPPPAAPARMRPGTSALLLAGPPDLPAVARRAAEVDQLVARAQALPEVRPQAVEAASSALHHGEIDSHVAIAAAIRALRLGR